MINILFIVFFSFNFVLLKFLFIFFVSVEFFLILFLIVIVMFLSIWILLRMLLIWVLFWDLSLLRIVFEYWFLVLVEYFSDWNYEKIKKGREGVGKERGKYIFDLELLIDICYCWNFFCWFLVMNCYCCLCIFCSYICCLFGWVGSWRLMGRWCGRKGCWSSFWRGWSGSCVGGGLRRGI